VPAQPPSAEQVTSMVDTLLADATAPPPPLLATLGIGRR
jgi:hypothetical protein